MRFFLAILCVIPSAWVNVNAQKATGAGDDILLGIAFLAVMAAVFTMCAATSFERRRYVMGCLWSLVAAVFIAVNTIIALSGISGVRDAAMDKRAGQQQQSSDRKTVEAQILDLRQKAKAASTAIVQAEMNLLGNWSREKAKVRLEASREADKLQAKIDGWGAGTEAVPSSTDPGIANIIALVVAIFDKKLDERFLAAMLSGSFALLLELGADLGPIAIITLKKPNSIQISTLPKNPSKNMEIVEVLDRFEPEKPLLTIENDNQSTLPVNLDWEAAIFQVVDDGWTTTKQIYDTYSNWGRKRGITPMTINMFGRAMGKRYKREKRGGIWGYNVELKPEGIRLVT